MGTIRKATSTREFQGKAIHRDKKHRTREKAFERAKTLREKGKRPVVLKCVNKSGTSHYTYTHVH